MNYRAYTWAALVLVVMLSGCSTTPPNGTNSGSTAPSADKLHVIATFSILGDLVQNVGGDQLELEVLVGADGDTHSFEPAPADILKLANADLIFENGIEFETWLDDIYEASESDAARVIVTQNIDLLTLEVEKDHEGEEDHGHGELDPHVWHDVRNVVSMVEVIRDALIEADPENADHYETNASEYLAALGDLDNLVRAEADALPVERRKLVTSHDTFSYFGQAYNFEILGTALGSITTESGEAAAGELAALIGEIQAAGVPAIFAENVLNPGFMEQVASEAGVALAPPLYTDALGLPGTEGDTYIKMMRYNIATIVQALN